ncbi:MAG: MliC family protein [Sphingomonadaceae bacterium]
MTMRLLLLAGCALAISACGRPAAEQPPQQTAETAAPAAETAPTATGEAAPVAADWPAVPSEADIAAAAAAAGLQPTPEDRMRLECDNGEKVIVRFFPEQGVVSLARAGGNTEMQREEAASGLRYAGGGLVLTGKGEAYTLDLGGGVTTACKAV